MAPRVLSVADGEGRNSVYLATLGHDVRAFDLSPNAVAKARTLAAEAGVDVAFNLSGIEDWDWTQPVDAIVAIFIQFQGPEARAATFARFREGLAPGRSPAACTAMRRGRSTTAPAARPMPRTCIPCPCCGRPSRAGRCCMRPITTQ